VSSKQDLNSLYYYSLLSIGLNGLLVGVIRFIIQINLLMLLSYLMGLNRLLHLYHLSKLVFYSTTISLH